MIGKTVACAVLTVWLVASQAQAEHAWPVPLYMPDIEHPKSLGRTSWPERISLRIQIRADGSVRFVEVVEGDDPELVAMARQTVEQWRFKPWTPPASSPEGEVIGVTFQYSGTGGDSQPLAGNLRLAKLLCHQLNEESRRQNDGWLFSRKTQEPGIFQETERYLSHDPVIRTYVSEAQRQDLLVALLDARTEVMARCKANPLSRYVDQLPEKVRQAL